MGLYWSDPRYLAAAGRRRYLAGEQLLALHPAGGVCPTCRVLAPCPPALEAVRLCEVHTVWALPAFRLVRPYIAEAGHRLGVSPGRARTTWPGNGTGRHGGEGAALSYDH